jgi:hypothetical protein
VSKVSALFVALASVAALSACTPKRGDLVEKHRAGAEQVRQQLSGVARLAQASAPVAEKTRCAAPATPLSYSPQGASHDTEVLTVEELVGGGDPDAKAPEVELGLRSPLRTLLADTHAKSKLSAEERAARDGAAEKAYARALGVKWIVAVRERDHDRTTGNVAVDYHLFPIAGGAPVCSGTFTARVNPNLGTQVYDIVETDKATGERRLVKSGKEDRYMEQLQAAVRRILGEQLESDLAIELR